MRTAHFFTNLLFFAALMATAAPHVANALQAGGAQTAQSADPKTAQSDKSDKKAGVTPPRAVRPGKDRWLVKTASDPDVHDVAMTPQKTTLEDLLKLPRSVDMPLTDSNPTMQEHRARPVETTVYSVEVDVIDCRLMPDGDYRVTLRGASGKTIVMEMPNPAPDFVDPKSPFATQIRQARVAFDGKIQPERQTKEVSGHARITGIGYWGRAYGGKAPDGNLIQLHPVLNVEWLAKPTGEFTAAKAAAPALPAKETAAPKSPAPKP